LGVRNPGFTVPLDLWILLAHLDLRTLRILLAPLDLRRIPLPPPSPPPPREGVFSPNVCCGSHGSSVISCVAWHIGSCFSDTCDDDDDDVLYLFLQKQNRSRAPPMCDWDIPDGILDI
jgi:hypothetical protein